MDRLSGFVGAREIAARLGVTRQYVDQLAHTNPSFPKPVHGDRRLRLWIGDEVEAWIERNPKRVRRRDQG